MTPEKLLLLEKRKAGFDAFYLALMPTLADFAEKMGINPAHEVLKDAKQFVSYLDGALQNLPVADDQDRAWLLTRMGYFIGEYFVQQYRGCWYVNEIPDSRYFGRYVVGRFFSLNNATLMLDPFEVAQVCVDSPIPRQLNMLLKDVDLELKGRLS
jgi:hypothetical protein